MQHPPFRTVRTAQGRSLVEVAKAAQIDPAHLSRIERGLSQPTLPVVYRLAKALGLDQLEKFLRPFTGEDS